MSTSAAVAAFSRELRARRPGRCLVVAHRGVAAGAIAENTAASARLALASGADVVETDVTATRDGVALAHHDGTEPVNLGIAANVATLTRAEADLHPHLAARFGGEPMRMPHLRDVVTTVRGRDALIHIDRAWQWWEPTLTALDALDMPEQIVLKAPARPEFWSTVAAHPVPYPAIAIVRSRADIDAMCALDVNWVGMEFIAASPADELAQPDAFAHVHEGGLAVLVNCENLDSGPPLFAGWDDHAAIADGGQTWGRLLDLGADDVQTDVPWLLDAYRRRVGDAVRTAREPRASSSDGRG